MSDEDQNKKNAAFLIKLIGILVVVLILYFTISPYQNCMREPRFTNKGGCLVHTNW